MLERKLYEEENAQLVKRLQKEVLQEGEVLLDAVPYEEEDKLLLLFLFYIYLHLEIISEIILEAK